MRNWNLIFFGDKNICKKGCEPTYEELKREFGLICSDNTLCCEPTYEELKPKNIPCPNPINCWLRAYLWGIETITSLTFFYFIYMLRAYLWGIETVLCLLLLKAKRIVASLPMRNWNLVYYQGIILLGCVASLPMRNWNRELLDRVPSFCYWVASLPMRNWN